MVTQKEKARLIGGLIKELLQWMKANPVNSLSLMYFSALYATALTVLGGIPIGAVETEYAIVMLCVVPLAAFLSLPIGTAISMWREARSHPDGWNGAVSDAKESLETHGV